MRKSLLIALLGLIPFALFAQQAMTDLSSPVGVWKTIDDVTGKPKSLVRIYEENGKLKGQIVQLFREPTEDQDPVCDKCSGDLHNRKVKGLVIMWGFQKDGDIWSGGSIFDPKKGNDSIYKSKLTLKNGGHDLVVRGYIGFSLFGRSQTWHREK
jgi:uncharacterized protein (DUF2147 family)